ncbi:MAG: 4-hydroxythreonine-4-phosphate dehydrogenase PdxA [Fibromonadaceae bacterium]|jgi:4-hydroxythreonine-4-phosphate dehydrogenase|nr:4-hydroxythreonine-4-phosphate dehydrogenase PdxA [Fibromonadaceae bacterium]
MKPILITIGDPNGIGPEICLKLMAKAPKTRHPVILVGDTNVLDECKEILKINKTIKCGIYADSVPFKGKLQPGKLSKAAGAASLAWVRQATELVQAGYAAAVVTAPLCKEAVEKTLPGFQGHTEYIGEMCGDKEPVLALVHGDWVVAHVSTHVSLAEAIKKAKPERIVKVGKLLNDFLIKYKGIKKPRIGVAGINPHAGENGLFGKEETLNIMPAVKRLRAMKINAVGPLPADVVFPQLGGKVFDGVIAMYHDQGHVVTKTLAFNLGKVRKVGGVNTTLGIPILRTSVDHGTGFDIAWQNKADPSSLRDALLLADKISTSDPLNCICLNPDGPDYQD